MLRDLEQALGYTFSNKSLLQTALTHSSHANEFYHDSLCSYERLEFLGDSILGFVVAEYLYRHYPNWPEGQLTRTRAEIVCERSLAAVATNIHLGDFLLLGHGGELDGSRKRESILCDVVESVIAATYLDGGFAAAKELIDRLVLSNIAAMMRKDEDYKTRLQELVQRKKNQQLSYHLTGESGPDHAKSFNVDVLLNGKPVGSGEGSSKKRAEQMAAKAAIASLYPGELEED